MRLKRSFRMDFRTRRSAAPGYHKKMGQWGRVGRMGQIICPIKSTSCQGETDAKMFPVKHSARSLATSSAARIQEFFSDVTVRPIEDFRGLIAGERFTREI